MPGKKVAGKKRSAGKGRSRAAGSGSLTIRAVGPAAESFGREIASLGERSGILAKRVGHLILDAAEFGVTKVEKVADYLRASVSEKLKDVPEEKIVEPDPRIAIPAIEALIYSINEEHIRDMFAHLLAADMNADTKSRVHPAFVNFIKEMTPLDAECLQELKKNPQIEFRPRITSNSLGADAGKRSYSIMTREGITADLETSIDNLERLGLVSSLTKSHSTQMFSIRYRVSSGGTSIGPRSKCNYAI
jgi:Abortive infection alpha